MTETSDSEIVSTRQRRIAQLAKQMPQKGLTSLNQHLDLAWLREAYRRTRKDGAVGIDGQTAADYERNLEENLRSLLERAKSGTYDCSYGFRPRRSAHDALDSLSKQTMWSGVSCILEVDIRKFFDTLDHAHLRAFLQQRIRDGVVLRLIGKWLNAGVMEDGAVTHPETGSPQGGVVSPVLANVYLHYVLDQWFAREVQPRLQGRAYVVRYADDFVVGFTDDGDARRVRDVLPKRFGRYGLTIHPHKTRLVPFRKPQGARKGADGKGPGTFDFLGFTHFWARSQQGNWILKRKTAASRRAPSEMVGGRSGRSTSGAGLTVTIRSARNMQHSARSFEATPRTTGLWAIARRWPVFTTRCSRSGSSGSRAGDGHGVRPGVGSANSWPAIRCRPCASSTGCAGAQRMYNLRNRMR